MKKRTVGLVLAAMMAVSLTACGGSGAGAPAANSASGSASSGEAEAQTASSGPESKDAGQKEKILIGYTLSDMSEGNKRLLDASLEHVEELNAASDDYEIELIYTDAQLSVDKQLSDVESLIQQKCNIILMSSVDLEGSKPSAQAIHDAGIVCVETRGMQDEAVDLQAGTDYEKYLSDLTREYVKKYLEENPSVVFNVGVLYGSPGMVDQLKRLEWVGELADEMPDRVKVVVEEYGNWVTDEAQSITEDWMQRYPEINAFAVGNDEMSLGVANVIESAGKSFDDYYIASSGGWDLGTQLVKEGKIDVDIRIDTVQTQNETIDHALEKYRGEFKDKIFQYSEKAFYPIDQTNVDE